jgi:hypothetical protein
MQPCQPWAALLNISCECLMPMHSPSRTFETTHRSVTRSSARVSTSCSRRTVIPCSGLFRRSWKSQCTTYMTAMSNLRKVSLWRHGGCQKKASLNILRHWSLFSSCPSDVTIEELIALVWLFSTISAVFKNILQGVTASPVLQGEVGMCSD